MNVKSRMKRYAIEKWRSDKAKKVVHAASDHPETSKSQTFHYLKRGHLSKIDHRVCLPASERRMNLFVTRT